MPLGPFGLVAWVGVGVRGTNRIVLPATQAPAKCQVRTNDAMRYAKLSDVDEGLKPKAPDPILKRGFGYRGDASSDQQIESAEEDRKRPDRQFVAWSSDEPVSGARHAFLDLVPADRRAP